jgi:uncharacterized protein (TIGR02145 family)
MINAQTDTVYFMRNGVIVYQKAVTEIDSILFYRPVINPYGSFMDPRDSTIYNTIIIGTQTWMSENLTYLPSVSSPDMGSQTTPHYYVNNYYGTDVAKAKLTCNYNDYGVLYNWPAAMAACPPGWHLPSNDEWITLTTFLGGENVSGGKLKDQGTIYWNAPNTNATNESGFSGLPGGMRDRYEPTYYHLGNMGYWWASTETASYSAKARNLFHNLSLCEQNHHYKDYGFSVRCVMNN